MIAPSRSLTHSRRHTAITSDLKNERAEEYSILGANLDATGDRLRSIDVFRKARSLRQEILAAKPNYAGIRQRLAKSTVDLGYQMGRFGERDEALRLMDAGIADFETLLKESHGDPSLIRALSSTEGKRGAVKLVNGDIAAARADFRRASLRMERLAGLDPENKTLQSDRWIGQFEDGRAIALAGRYAEALPILERSLQGYLSLHLEADLGPGPPAMQAWIAEAQARTHNLTEAVKNYQKAAAGLAEDQANFDDARCDLAMVYTKIGRALTALGKLTEAEAAYQKALDTADLSSSLEHADIPALYAAVDAFAGLAEVAEAKSRKTRVPSLQSKLLNDAQADYEKSLRVWKQIPYPARENGNGYAVVTWRESISSTSGSPSQPTRTPKVGAEPFLPLLHPTPSSIDGRRERDGHGAPL